MLSHINFVESDMLLNWQVFFDNISLEHFVDGGAIVATDIFFPNQDFDQISLFAFDGEAQLKSGELFELKSIW